MAKSWLLDKVAGVIFCQAGGKPTFVAGSSNMVEFSKADIACAFIADERNETDVSPKRPISLYRLAHIWCVFRWNPLYKGGCRDKLERFF